MKTLIKFILLLIIMFLISFSTKSQIEVSFDKTGEYTITNTKKLISIWNNKTGYWVSDISFNGSGFDISKDNKYIIVSGEPTKIYSFPNATLIKELPISSKDVKCLTNSEKVIFECSKGSLELWDIEANQKLNKYVHIDDYVALNSNVSPDGKYLAVSSFENSKVSIWDINSGKRITDIKFHKEGTTDISFSFDSKYLFLNGFEYAKIYHFEGTEDIKQFKKLKWHCIGTSFTNYSLELFVPNGRNPEIIDMLTDKITLKIPGNDGLESAALSSDGKFILVGLRDNKIARLISAPDGKLIKEFDCHSVADKKYKKEKEEKEKIEKEKREAEWERQKDEAIKEWEKRSKMSDKEKEEYDRQKLNEKNKGTKECRYCKGSGKQFFQGNMLPCTYCNGRGRIVYE